MPEHVPKQTAAGDSLHHFSGWAAVASGVVGLIALAALFVYLSTQFGEFQETGTIPPAGWVLLRINYAGVMLQALLLMPAAVTLDKLLRPASPKVSQLAIGTGVAGLCGVAVLRLLLLLTPAVSDILFMGPLGFVGVWLAIVNLLASGVLPRALRVVGLLAAIGLIIVGASFFFLGGLAVLHDGPFAYQDNAEFHLGIAIGGIPGFILYPIWAILTGCTLSRRRKS